MLCARSPPTVQSHRLTEPPPRAAAVGAAARRASDRRRRRRFSPSGLHCRCLCGARGRRLLRWHHHALRRLAPAAAVRWAMAAARRQGRHQSVGRGAVGAPARLRRRRLSLRPLPPRVATATTVPLRARLPNTSRLMAAEPHHHRRRTTHRCRSQPALAASAAASAVRPRRPPHPHRPPALRHAAPSQSCCRRHRRSAPLHSAVPAASQRRPPSLPPSRRRCPLPSAARTVLAAPHPCSPRLAAAAAAA